MSSKETIHTGPAAAATASRPVCIPFVFIIIGVRMIFAIAAASLVFIILGAVDASNGKARRYPCVVRLIK